MKLADIKTPPDGSVLTLQYSRWWRFAILISCGLFLIFALGSIVSWIVAGQLVAATPNYVGEPPLEIQAISFTIASESGSELAGWHSRAEESKGVVVLFHGLGESRLSMVDRATFLFEAGYSCVMIDFQAHGESPGEQITVGHLEQHDVTATIEFARSQHPDEPIAVIGVSLGGVSTLLASPLNIDAMILESVFPTIKAAIHNRVEARLGYLSIVPAEILLFQLNPRLGIAAESLRPVDHISAIGCPLFLISGSKDQHTTAEETQQMFELAHDPKQLWLVDGAEHVDLHTFQMQEYERKVLNFLSQAMM